MDKEIIEEITDRYKTRFPDGEQISIDNYTYNERIDAVAKDIVEVLEDEIVKYKDAKVEQIKAYDDEVKALEDKIAEFCKNNDFKGFLDKKFVKLALDRTTLEVKNKVLLELLERTIENVPCCCAGTITCNYCTYKRKVKEELRVLQGEKNEET